MKKLIVLLLTLTLSFSFVACGNDNTDEPMNDNNTTVEDNDDVKDNAAAGDNKGEDAQRIDRDIESVADYLDLKKGDEIVYDVIGAKAGRAYNGGDIELYEFDRDSAEYDKITKGEGKVKAAAHNEGIVLVFTKNHDDKLVEHFKNIRFK